MAFECHPGVSGAGVSVSDTPDVATGVSVCARMQRILHPRGAEVWADHWCNEGDLADLSLSSVQ